MQYTNDNTTKYLVRFRNSQKVNEACNVILITKGLQEHGMKILLPFHNNGFDSLQEDDMKVAEKAGEEILCEILYLENSDKARFFDLKKRVENYYVLNKAEYPRTVNAVQRLLLNYQHNYNSKRNSQSNGIRNQLMFAQQGKTGDEKDNKKYNEQRPSRKLDNISCNDCGEKIHYIGNSE